PTSAGLNILWLRTGLRCTVLPYMNHQTLAKQLIRALRGKRSQVALSRRMKCRSNVVYSWESGRRWPTAATFFELAQKTGIDLRAGLSTFLGALPDDLVGQD